MIVALTWDDVEWFLQYWANPLAAVALIGVTSYYAIATWRILAARSRQENLLVVN